MILALVCFVRFLAGNAFPLGVACPSLFQDLASKFARGLAPFSDDVFTIEANFFKLFGCRYIFRCRRV